MQFYLHLMTVHQKLMDCCSQTYTWTSPPTVSESRISSLTFFFNNSKLSSFASQRSYSFQLEHKHMPTQCGFIKELMK